MLVANNSTDYILRNNLSVLFMYTFIDTKSPKYVKMFSEQYI